MGGVDWNIHNFKFCHFLFRHHPHGWCGLKFKREKTEDENNSSPPTWVVWIEISNANDQRAVTIEVTTHTGGVDWNFKVLNALLVPPTSPPTRVVWIEIYRLGYEQWCNSMSPPTWVVWIEILCIFRGRNFFAVTTHMGGVDWNTCPCKSKEWAKLSPPTWVVWIEILIDALLAAILVCHHPHGWCG